MIFIIITKYNLFKNCEITAKKFKKFNNLKKIVK